MAYKDDPKTPGNIEDATIERLLNATSVASNQDPTGIGPSNAIQIEFGPAQFGPSDPVQIDVNGTITFNETGLYRVKSAAQIGRTGAAGVSELLLRVKVNGAQSGRTIAAKLENANSIMPFIDEAWLNIPSGTVIVYEIMRDASGNNSGGLVGQDVTVVAGSWNQDVCEELRIERYRS